MTDITHLLGKVHNCDCLLGLKALPDNSVNCCVTSPPYFGLRQYGIGRENGEIGLEEDPQAYVDKMVAVFREVRRVLKPDGTVFLNLGDSYFSGGMSNLSNLLKRRFEKGIFFFGCPDPRGCSAEGINILLYDKRSPDSVFKPFFSAKRVSIKNGKYDFCEVGGFLNSPVKCFIGTSLCLTLPDTTAHCFLNMSDNIGIIIAAGDLNTDPSIGRAVMLSIKNSQTSLTIEIPGEPIAKSVPCVVPVFDTVNFNTGTVAVPDIKTVNNSVPLLDSPNLLASPLGYFTIRESGLDKFSLVLHSGADIGFLGVRHIFSYSSNGLMPYHSILAEEIKRFNYHQPKQELGIPFMVRQALMEDGWICRQTIIWAKPNPMPESVTDRCTKSHEYIFLLSKGPKYYFDNEAIKEPAAWERWGDQKNTKKLVGAANLAGDKTKEELQTLGGGKRNKRDVWTVATQPYKGAHFATFPPELIRPCVLAGAPAGGLILDPFMGAATVALVCKQEGRQYIGFELNPTYVEMGERRIKHIKQQLKLF